jgi:hemophore-related protein
MATLSLTRLAVAVGGLALSLTAGAGVASADPDLGPVVNTTCNYSQFTAALNAQDPAAAAQLNGSLVAQAYLRQFLASPPGQRQQMLPGVPGTPWTEQYVGTLVQVANTCNTY